MNEDIQNEMEVTQVPDQPNAEANTSNTGEPIDKTVMKKKVNFKKLVIVSSVLIVVWALMILVYLMYFKPDVSTENTNNNGDTLLPTVTVLPTIAFEMYSDDYLEFEHPVGADVLVEGQRIYHPSETGKSINGVVYTSIIVQDKFKLEAYNYMIGGEFPFKTYDPESKVLTDWVYDQPDYTAREVVTNVTQEPIIKELDQVDGYLLRFNEQKMTLLMSLNEEGIYESVNYGLWEELDFLGSFAGDSNYDNFIGLTCEIQNEYDYRMCEQLTTRFLDTVEKKFVEDEKFEEPKLETTLELRNPDTAELINKYRFYFENFEEGTYLNSSWNSFAVHNGQTRLGLSFFEPTNDFADISFSDLRDSAPTPDIQATQVFSNLLRGEHKASLGGQVSKYYTYSMYYPDPNKTECYKLERPGVDVENYVGCTSYKLKLKGIDATIQATCNYSPDLPDSWKVCDEMIKELKVSKI